MAGLPSRPRLGTGRSDSRGDLLKHTVASYIMPENENCPRSDERRRQKPHPQGGLHRSPAGITTLDSLSEVEWVEDMKRRLDDFLAQQEAVRYGVHAGREW